MKRFYTFVFLLFALFTGSSLFAQCINPSSWGAAIAPTGGGFVDITFCMFAGEYNTLTGVTGGQSYISTTDLAGGFFTITQGAPAGPVVAFGPAPLNWTAPVGGTYYIHLNLNAGCGTDGTCHSSTVTHNNSCLPAPNGASATPASFCAGNSSDLTAISAGGFIRWYTVPTGGAPLTTVVSGGLYNVSPVVSTTYYAEGFDGGACFSGTRTPVTVTVTSLPADPINVTATPATICLGNSSDLRATAGNGTGIINDFQGPYDPAMWTTTHTPITDVGTVNTAGAPNTVALTSSNGGNFGIHSVVWTVTVPGNGTISFDWDYVTTDVDGAAFDYPQYSINGGAFIDFPGFDPAGADIQSGTFSMAVTAGQTFSIIMTASDDILGAATTVLSNFSGPDSAPGTIDWYTTAVGGVSIGSSASGAPFNVSPIVTTTYYAESVAGGCISAGRTPVTVTVETPSTAPTMSPMPGTYCPNTTLNLTAGGGVAGTGSTLEWYTGPNGTGTWLGTGAAYNFTPLVNGEVIYVRREGSCNNTADDFVVINLKTFVYGLNGASTATYCTDNGGWQHFYIGDEIILSVIGDLTGASPGYPVATIWNNGSYYQNTQGPGTPAGCGGALSPGEERFEMERSWNLDFGGGAVNPPYDLRFYYNPAEKTAIENAANAHIAAFPACGYSYKYPNPNGFFWFKNTGANYVAPQWDGTHYAGPTGMAGGTTNYVELTGITSFSGGSGAVILVPTIILPVELLSFEGSTDNRSNFLRWETRVEQGTSHFNVQRSKDGVSFNSIGTVAAQGGTQNSKYTFDDLAPLNGENFYRLEIADADGKSTLSNTVMLNLSTEASGYTFYPNPSTEVIHYQFTADSKETLEIEVFDMYGKLLASTEFVSEIGLTKIPVNLRDYPIGSYLIRVHHLTSGKVHTTKALKVK